jgi:hypothetical protein
MIHPSDLQRIALTASVGVVYCLLCPGIARAEQHIACPQSVDSRQVRVDSPDGWTGIYGPGGTLKLRGAGAIFVVSSLRDSWGELKDPPTRKKGKETIVTYPLPSEVDKYVICDYGNLVYLAMKLPEATKQCEVVSRRAQDPLEPRRKLIDVIPDIVCK